MKSYKAVIAFIVMFTVSAFDVSAERFECWYQAIIGVAIAEYGLNEDLLNKVLSYA